jgi:hypothetical protein
VINILIYPEAKFFSRWVDYFMALVIVLCTAGYSIPYAVTSNLLLFHRVSIPKCHELPNQSEVVDLTENHPELQSIAMTRHASTDSLLFSLSSLLNSFFIRQT